MSENKTGKITKIVNDQGLQYGFVKVPKVGDVFFSQSTRFNQTEFEKLELGKSVKISVIQTERGLFAEALTLK